MDLAGLSGRLQRDVVFGTASPKKSGLLAAEKPYSRRRCSPFRLQSVCRVVNELSADTSPFPAKNLPS